MQSDSPIRHSASNYSKAVAGASKWEISFEERAHTKLGGNFIWQRVPTLCAAIAILMGASMCHAAMAQEIWRSDEVDNHHGHVILLDGCLYGSSSFRNWGKWICLDWHTGEMRYAERSVGKGTLTCADGMLYTLGESETVGLIGSPRGSEPSGGIARCGR